MPSPDDLVASRRRAFGARLRQLRSARGLSQDKVAAAAGLTRPYYSGVELGRHNISLDNQFAIADAFGVHISELFDLDPR